MNVLKVNTKLVRVDGKLVTVAAASGANVEHISWHQCPTAVSDYLKNVTYSPDDYSVSYINEYAPDNVVITNTLPVGRAVDDVTYYNEEPNQLTPFSATTVAGTLKPLDALRWINAGRAAGGWPFCVNMRDLGGWACDGGKVRYGLLYRCGQPEANAREVLVNQLGIRGELDLQGADSTRTTSVLGNDVQFCRPPRYQWYTIADTEIWQQLIQFVFDNVRYGRPMIFHCAAGADRTGTLACVLEGLLGLDQSDIDKDYELTCFYSGVGTDALARRRNESDWISLINAIKAVPLPAGVSDTFRNHVVYFVASLGFSADDINAYRAAMIDGTPDTIVLSLDTYDITKTTTNVTVDNEITSVSEYQGYEANVNAKYGYVINKIKVTMGGKDITSTCFNEQLTTLNRSVTTTLTNCTSDNSRKAVIDGQSFAMNLTADGGYTLDGAQVTITMGGLDMSTYYANGKIAIPKVIGDLVITITAVPSALLYTNQIPLSIDSNGTIYNGTGYKTESRINSSGVVGTATSGGLDSLWFATGFIPVKGGDIIRFKNAYIEGTTGGANTQFYDASKNALGYAFSPYSFANQYDSTAAQYGPVEYDTSTQRLYSFTVPNTASASTIKYVRFTLHGDAPTAIVTVNEEIE